MNLYSFTHTQLKKYFIEKKLSGFRADQIFYWMYQKKVDSFYKMSNLGKELQDYLNKKFTLSKLKLLQILKSQDKETIKFLFELEDKNLIETVLIISGNRHSVCVSSQVGCAAACLFCASGKKGLVRDLKAEEIVEQVLQIERFLQKDISHIVFMGMGEPLANYENVVQSIKVFNDPKGLNISQRKMTISTVGITDNIKKLVKEDFKINLTLSLHAPNQLIREKIIPYAKQYPFEDLIDVMREYFTKTRRDVTFEYILIEGVNDQEKHAKELAEKLSKAHFNINLIPYNPIQGPNIKKPKKEAIEKFKKILEKNGCIVTRRYTKGDDIAAACGQLAGNEN